MRLDKRLLKEGDFFRSTKFEDGSQGVIEGIKLAVVTNVSSRGVIKIKILEHNSTLNVNSKGTYSFNDDCLELVED